MQADLEDFKTGWYGLTLGVDANEIDKLIAALHHLKDTKEHFHFRSEFEGKGGIGDIEFYYRREHGPGNLEIECDFRESSE